MMRVSRGTLMAALLGLAISGLLLWLALRHVSPQEFQLALAEVQTLPLSFAAVAIAVGIFLRSLRWRLLAGDAAQVQIRYSRAAALGVFANFVLPARVGELVRVALLHKLLPAPLTHVLGNAFADRLADVVMLVAAASALYVLTPVHDLIGGWLAAFLVALAGVAVAVIGPSRRHAFGRVVVQRLAGYWRARWSSQPLDLLSDVRGELVRSLRRARSRKVAAAALAVLIADYLTVATVFRAFGLDLPAIAPLTLWVFLAAGSTLPSAPGYVGVYQLAAVWALSLYAVPAATAVAVATVFQGLTLFVGGLLAGVSAWGLRAGDFAIPKQVSS